LIMTALGWEFFIFLLVHLLNLRWDIRLDELLDYRCFLILICESSWLWRIVNELTSYTVWTVSLRLESLAKLGFVVHWNLSLSHYVCPAVSEWASIPIFACSC
jgi:hypothetical protein